MTSTRKFLTPTLVLLALMLLYNLTGCQLEQEATQPRLKLAGSTTVEPVARAAAQAYMDRFPDVRVTVRGGGSTIGVKGVAYGALHIGMASRSLQDKELEQWPDLTLTVIGRDGVSVIVNPTLYQDGVQQLTLNQVAAIWRGEITNWQQVGGPDLPITVFDKAMEHGTRATFAQIVLGDAEATAPGAAAVLGENEAVITTVSEYPGAVSILSTGWPTDKVVGVAIVGEDGQAVEPTTENVAQGDYPISRDLNLITEGAPEDQAAEFIAFMLSPEGQAIVENAGYSRIDQEK